MPERSYELAGTRIFECAAEGAPLKTTGDAIELISIARSYQANLLVIPTARLHDDFFRLNQESLENSFTNSSPMDCRSPFLATFLVT